MARTKRKFETSLTLDYRRNARGIERIVLDSISNHLPADSKGKNTSIKFKQEDKWIDFKEYNPEKSVQEIIFEDDGQGYDARLLTVLFSSKTEDVLSVGQFGEGLKLVAAACLRNGIKVEYKSQNWTATPYAKPEKIGDHDLERLCFEVKENGTHVQGSRTRFIEPSKKLIEEILNLPEKVLFFNDEYKELYGRPTISGNFSRVIDLNKKQRSVFIKGVKIKNVNSLFSYDLGLENISPDRASFDEDKILDEIERLLRGCENTELIKQIIRYAKEHPQAPVYEFSALNKHRKVDLDLFDNRRYNIPMLPGIITFFLGKKLGKSHISKKDRSAVLKEDPFYVDLSGCNFANHADIYAKIQDLFKQTPWIKSFYDLYGENAVLASYNTNENTDAELLGFKPVRLHHSIETMLADLGVKNASQIENEKEYKWIKYKDLTPEEKALVDDVPNLVKFIAGKDVSVKVKIYEGMFLKTGREVESNTGVQITEANGKKYVGIRRSQLKDPVEFYTTLTHEFGHFYTDREDHSRDFAQFFIRKLAEKYCAQQGIPHAVEEFDPNARIKSLAERIDVDINPYFIK